MTTTVIIDDKSPPGSWAYALKQRGLDPETGKPKEREAVTAAAVVETFRGMAETGFKAESGGKPGAW